MAANRQAGNARVGEHAAPAVVLPDTAAALDGLRRLQQARQQLAIVVDEHGSIDGIVTVEDLIEELVGEIWDEVDPDVRAVQRGPDGSIIVVGTFPVHDLVDLGVQIPPGDYTTVAGVVLAELGHLPMAGEEVTVGSWRLQVVERAGQAISRVRLSPAPDTGGAPTPQ